MMKARMLMIGLVIVTVIVHMMRVWFLKYVKNNPIMPCCIRCHDVPNSIKAKMRVQKNMWIRLFGNVLCFDHLFMDGGKLISIASNRSLNKVMPSVDDTFRPPANVFFDMAIEDLIHPEYTKYECFCYHAGKHLKSQRPELLFSRHICADKHSKKNGYMAFYSRGLYFVDAPMGELVKIKEQPRMYWYGLGFFEMMRYHFLSDALTPIIVFVDWRFFYDLFGLQVDEVLTDRHGQILNHFNVTVLKSSSRYYAVAPYGSKRSPLDILRAQRKSGI